MSRPAYAITHVNSLFIGPASPSCALSLAGDFDARLVSKCTTFIDIEINGADALITQKYLRAGSTQRASQATGASAVAY